MKKQMWAMLIALLVLLLLGAVYLWLKSEQAPAPVAPEAQEPTIAWQTVLLEDAQNVSEISVENPEDTYAFYKENGKWVLKSVPKARLLSYNIDDLANMVSFVRALDVFAPEDALSSYGLENPKVVASVSYQNGNIHTIALGDMLPNGSGYYGIVDDSDRIYVIDPAVGDMLWHQAAYYRETTVLNISQNSLKSMRICQDGKEKLHVVPIPETERGIRFSMWKIIAPVQVNVDDTAFMQKVCHALNPVSISEFVDNPGDLAAYGIGKHFVEASDGATNVRLYFGDRTEAGVYVWDGISPYIGIVKSFPFDTLSYSDVMDMHVLLEFMDDVASIEIRYPEKTYRLKAENGSFWINDQQIEDSIYKNLYQKIASLKYADVAKEDAVFSEETLSVTMQMTDGSIRFARFFAYSPMEYCVATEGLSGCIIEKKIVDNLEGMLMVAEEQ